jgi:hypothetical protein
MRQIKRLNVDLIFKELRPLLELKEAPEIEDRLRKMMEKEKLENETCRRRNNPTCTEWR